jgi:hypothetical protein
LHLVSEWIASFLFRSANSLLPCFRRQGFGRQTNKNNGQQQSRGNGQLAPSPTGYQSSSSSIATSISPAPQSPDLRQAMSFENMQPQDSQPRRPPFFFRDDYANLIVKGNFMTLAAKPVLVEEGEWLAHQGALRLTFLFCHTLANHQDQSWSSTDSSTA